LLAFPSPAFLSHLSDSMGTCRVKYRLAGLLLVVGSYGKRSWRDVIQ